MISYRQADLLQNIRDNVPTITVYFETVDPESIERGDFVSQGVEDEFKADWSKDGADLVQWAIDNVEHYKPLEYSDSHPDLNKLDGWFRTTDAKVDYENGSETSYSIHFKHFTPEQNKQIYQALIS